MLKLLQKNILGVHAAAITILVLTFFSYILSLVRVNLLTTNFGSSGELDLFFAAFRIPDLIFILIGSLITGFVLIPFFTRKQKDGTLDRHLNAIFTTYLVILLIAIGIIFILLPKIQHILLPGFDADSIVRVNTLTRIMLLQPVILAISFLFSSVVQVWRKFIIFSLSPIFYNLGVILGIVFLGPEFGINGAAYGVMIGAGLHLLFPLISIIENKTYPKFVFVKKEEFKTIFDLVKHSIPRTLGLSFIFITQFIFISFATIFPQGSVTTFQLAFDLHFVPVTLISISYSVASFPHLSLLFLEGKIDEFKQSINETIKYIIMLSFPVIALFILLVDNITKVIFGVNSFSDQQFYLLGISLIIFIVSIIATGIIQIISRAFFAMKNTAVSFWINFFIMLGSISLLLLFSYIHRYTDIWVWVNNNILDISTSGSEIIVLPLILSFMTILGGSLFLFVFSRKLKFSILKEFLTTALQNLFAVVVGYIAAERVFTTTIGVFNQVSLFGLLFHGVLVGVVFSIVWFVTLIVIKNTEAKNILKIIISKKYEK